MFIEICPAYFTLTLALGYSIISPIINGLACATFVLFYMLYKYLFTWQLALPPAGDSGGLFFPRAVQHVFVGLYVQQVGGDGVLMALLYFVVG